MRCSGRSPTARTRSRTCMIAPVSARRAGLAVRPGQSESTMLIDATQKHPMAPLALPTREYMEQARGDLGRARAARRSTPRSPWHGYTLGDWTDTWERFAQRAARGDWEQNGIETLARSRGGLDAGDAGRQSREAGAERIDLKPAPFTYHDPRTVDRSARSARLARERARARRRAVADADDELPLSRCPTT